MPYQIENRMVVDAAWLSIAPITLTKCTEPGYREISTQLFVSEEEAFDYAMNQCMNGPLSEEFKSMLIEWYYSGNWIKEK